MTRPLHALPCRLDEASVDEVRRALAAASSGEGPALLPVPADDPAAAARTAAVLRADDVDAPVDDNVAVVIATSGSTGEPKGVLLSAGALHASAHATLDVLGGPGSWLLALSPTHIAGLQVLVRSMLAGTEPEVLDATAGFHPAEFAAASQRVAGPRRYTALVPTQLVRLLEAGGVAVKAAASYDAVLLGGAAAPRSLLERARSAGVRVVTTYGMSETSGGCVYDGRSLDGVTTEVGGDGRIVLGGPVLASGYRLRPDLTADAFAGGGFRTSDLGRLEADGRLTVLGRADDMIVTGGEKVPAAAVEDALAEHPGVREAAVFGAPDAAWGQRVEAVVVPVDPDAPPSLEELRTHVGARLSRVAAPRAVHVVAALPLLPSGKVDRAALASLPVEST